MDEKQLADLEALANAAAEGPWVLDHRPESPECYYVYAPNSAIICTVDEMDEDEFLDDEVRQKVVANLAFVAAARKAVPDLIEEIRRLQTMVEPTPDAIR